MSILKMPANIRERSVKIVRSSDRKSITQNLDSMIGDIGKDIALTSLHINEEQTPFLLEGDTITFKVTNETSLPFENILPKGGKVGKLISVATGLYEGFTALQDPNSTGYKWNPWFAKIPAWESTRIEGMTFSFSFSLGQYGLWNATKEVVLPTIALMLPVLPAEVGAFTMKGPFPSAVSLLVALAKSALDVGNILDITDMAESKTLSETISSVLLNAVSQHTYNISVGNILTLQHAYARSGDVTLSTNIDQHGMPIHSNVKITFEGMVPPAARYNDSVPATLRFGGG